MFVKNDEFWLRNGDNVRKYSFCWFIEKKEQQCSKDIEHVYRMRTDQGVLQWNAKLVKENAPFLVTVADL